MILAIALTAIAAILLIWRRNQKPRTAQFIVERPCPNHQPWEPADLAMLPAKFQVYPEPITGRCGHQAYRVVPDSLIETDPPLLRKHVLLGMEAEVCERMGSLVEPPKRPSFHSVLAFALLGWLLIAAIVVATNNAGPIEGEPRFGGTK